MWLCKNCGDCIFEFSVKGYVRNTINLSCAKILLPCVIGRCQVLKVNLRPKFCSKQISLWLFYVRILVSANSIESTEFCSKSLCGILVRSYWFPLRAEKCHCVLFTVTPLPGILTGTFSFTNPNGFAEQLMSPVEGHVRLFSPTKIHAQSPVHWNLKFYFVITERTHDTPFLKPITPELNPSTQRCHAEILTRNLNIQRVYRATAV
jgi:hypothetical protein